MDLQANLLFFKELELLKTVTRQNKTLDGRYENSAEHSWQSALMAVVLQAYFPEEINMEKVMMMLLVHDLGEVHAGDTSVFDEKGKATSYQRELISLTETLQYLPVGQAEYCLSNWQEFEKGNTPEARYARVIDAVVPLFNHLLTGGENDNPTGLTKQAILEKKAFIKEDAPDLWSIVVQVIDASVSKGLYID